MQLKCFDASIKELKGHLQYNQDYTFSNCAALVNYKGKIKVPF